MNFELNGRGRLRQFQPRMSSEIKMQPANPIRNHQSKTSSNISYKHQSVQQEIDLLLRQAKILSETLHLIDTPSNISTPSTWSTGAEHLTVMSTPVAATIMSGECIGLDMVVLTKQQVAKLAELVCVDLHLFRDMIASIISGTQQSKIISLQDNAPVANHFNLEQESPPKQHTRRFRRI